MASQAQRQSDGRKERVVYVAGATSQIGRFLLPMLTAGGRRVYAISRAAPREAPISGVEWLRADISAKKGIRGLANPACEWIHIAPLPTLPPLLEGLAAFGVKRIVAFGSTSRFTKADSPHAGERRLAAGLAEAEQALAERCAPLGMAWTIFRPTLIYGGDGSAVEFIERKIRTFGFYPLAGGGSGLRQPVHAGDLAGACLAVLENPTTHQRAYDLAGGEVLSYRAMVERIFHSVGRKPRMVSIPTPVFAAGIALLKIIPRYRELTTGMVARMNEDLCFDVSNAAQDFGYAARDFLSQTDRHIPNSRRSKPAAPNQSRTT